MSIREVLESVNKGNITIDEAEKYIKAESFKELGYAKIDTNRKERTGFAEVIYCSGKEKEHLLNIIKRIYEKEGEVLGTRASKEQYEFVKQEVPNIEYDSISRIIKIDKIDKIRSGKVVVCSAGTADIKVAEEAAQVAEYFGCNIERIYDVGVSGIHRLFSKLDRLEDANCIIAVAGMEGALPTVLGGLVNVPVIAVPTSIGYGANFNGLSALLTMINSCANGVTVVNIDNGYGAGYVATQINKLACKNK